MIQRTLPTIVLFLVALPGIHATAQKPGRTIDDITVDAVADSNGVVQIVVSGFDEEHADILRAETDYSFLQIWLEGSDIRKMPPLAGVTTFRQNQLVFTPEFPMQPGKRFEVHVSLPFERQLKFVKIVSIKRLRNNSTTPTTIETIYPTARPLPENLLKFYVHFSGPMRKGDIYQFIKLREKTEKNGNVIFREIELPFLEIEQEFWSVDSRRLTLLLDPGRIKRGLKPRQEMGPIFEANRHYELVIDGNWPDANGLPLHLGLEHEKRQSTISSTIFKTTTADHSCPDPRKWQIEAPAVGSKSPLNLKFGEPLDSAMLRRVINVFDPKGKLIDGEVELSEHETVWTLNAKSVWVRGDYEIRIDNRLEDLCGNSIAKLFDVDVLENKPSGSSGVTVLKFQVR